MGREFDIVKNRSQRLDSRWGDLSLSLMVVVSRAVADQEICKRHRDSFVYIKKSVLFQLL